MEIGVDPASLVHALQNHDELTYELVHFAAGHKDEVFELNGMELTGAQLAEQVQQTLRERLTGENAPYNAVFTTNGIACTTVSFIMAALGVQDPDAMTPEVEAQVLDVHMLLVMYNALQPGVFALSGWDLAGMQPLTAKCRRTYRPGDTRWINRGAHDIMGTSPDAKASSAGMPRARSLYGITPPAARESRLFRRAPPADSGRA